MQAETKYKVIGISLVVLIIAGLFGVKWIVDYRKKRKRYGSLCNQR